MPALRSHLPSLGRWPRRVAALACLLLAAVTAVAAHGNDPGRRPQRSPVVVSSRDLPAGRTLRAADLQLAHWPAELVPHGAATTVASLVGRRLSGPLVPHEPVLATRLLGPGLTTGLAASEVAVPVRVTDPADGALLRPGERVELLAAAPATLSAPPQRATILAQHALILAVLPESERKTAADNNAATGLIVAIDRDSAGRFAALNGGNVLAVVGKAP